jgi:glycopeptide antibiotics resistance protein
LIFTSLLSRLERTLFRNLSDFWYVIAAAFLIVLLMEIYQHLFVYRKVQIVYEEEPEPALIGLDPSS